MQQKNNFSSTKYIRPLFLDYFCKNDHKIIPSSSLIPKNDPSLIFTNSGMVQFKQFITSPDEKVGNAVTCQKCLRVGGKHNDLENVGFTSRHHTFFEMLGNFSFGVYFKERAIELAWKFIVDELKLEKEKLYVTVYHDDEEAFSIWRKVTNFAEDKIIKIATQDNFWSMGETGPCGPCSEIFYDHGENVMGGLPGTEDSEGDRFVEIWNLVFMQYNRNEKGELNKLSKKCIDTGMGLERITAVVEGVHDNYDTSLFKAIINRSQEVTGDKNNILAHRIIADHTRAISFLIADGIIPSNEGRGYVLRRIIRRAMRYLHKLGVIEPSLYKIFSVLIEENSLACMSDVYPELLVSKNLIASVLKTEEEGFRDALSRGIVLLEKEVSHLVAGDTFSGESAFKLYDTYGFPLDITLDFLKERKLSFDQIGFEDQMLKQRERSRKNWIGFEKKIEETWPEILSKFGKTEFLGYECLEVKDARILAIISEKNDLINFAKKGEKVDIILNKTVFYGESGGQQGDTGFLMKEQEVLVKVMDVKKLLEGLYVHRCLVEEGEICTGETVTAVTDKKRRKLLCANHSCTHLLHYALKNVLGSHIVQKGSLVAPDKLRFDFNYNEPVRATLIAKIEDIVNQMIVENNPVNICVENTKTAIEKGAMALFGEKYGEHVRVVSIGDSKELCGGTHVIRSGDIGLFKITFEGGIASGIRRIEAITGQKAIDHFRRQEEALGCICLALKAQSVEIASERIRQLKKENKNFLSVQSDLYMRIAKSEEITSLHIKEVNFLSHVFKDIPATIIRELVIKRKQDTNSIIVFASIFDKKLTFIVGVSKELTYKVNSNDIVQIIGKITNSKGGGSLEIAQINIDNHHQVDYILKKIQETLNSI